MAKIETLINDIYETLEKPIEVSDDDIEKFGEDIKTLLKERLAEGGSKEFSLRLSNIGVPDRKLWYSLKYPDNNSVKGRLRLQFLYGDIIELLVLYLARLSGHTITHEQHEVEIEGVQGHTDGKIDGVLVDLKSASPYGYNKFKNHTLTKDDPFGYIPQISAYAEAEGEDEGMFLAVNKVTGDMCLTPIHSMEMINASDRIKHLKKVMEMEEPPEKCYDPVPYGKSGNHVLALGCFYCQHKFDCWSDANNGKGLRVFQYKQGKEYFTNISKEPKVVELFGDDRT